MNETTKFNNNNRRQFLRNSSALGIGAAVGIGSLAGSNNAYAAMRRMQDESSSTHHFQLGLAAYSLRDYFKFMKGKPQAAAEGGKQFDMFQFIDYCRELGLAGAELTSYFFAPDANQDYFRRIKRHAFKNGVTISGTAIGNNFSNGAGDQLIEEMSKAKAWIDNAAEMGALHVRFFAGTAKDFAQHPDNMKYALDALQRCSDYAEQRGVFIGVENHGNLTADQMLQIVDGVESEWFGINLDTGNFNSEDPYADLVRCAPHAVNVQVKVKMKKPDGTKYDADLDRIAKILKEANYRGFVVLEYEEEDALKHVPKWVDAFRKSMA